MEISERGHGADWTTLFGLLAARGPTLDSFTAPLHPSLSTLSPHQFQNIRARHSCTQHPSSSIPLNYPNYHCYFTHGVYTFVQLLLDHGVSVEAINKHGNTPLYLAVRSGYTSVVELLLRNGALIEFSVGHRQPGVRSMVCVWPDSCRPFGIGIRAIRAVQAKHVIGLAIQAGPRHCILFPRIARLSLTPPAVGSTG